MTLQLDPDLYEQLQVAPVKVRRSLEKCLYTQQQERDEAEKRREEMTPIRRRRDIVRENISKRAIEREDIHHIHSVLGLCALPYKKPPEGVREYERQYGLMSLRAEAGTMFDPMTGTWVKCGLPYGPKARLLQLHICTRALRQNNPVVELDKSLSSFLRSIGVSKGGGRRGSFTQFKEQLIRLSVCRFLIGVWNGKDRAKSMQFTPIDSIEMWLPKHQEDQKLQWTGTVTLSERFFNSLKDHALPVDIRAVSALSHSARQIDVLLWLSYRVREIDKRYFLPWKVVQEQFCQSATMRPQDFQKQFKEDIKDMEEIFGKKLPMNLDTKGLWLHPCDLDKLFVPAKNLLTIL